VGSLYGCNTDTFVLNGYYEATLLTTASASIAATSPGAWRDITFTISGDWNTDDYNYYALQLTDIVGVGTVIMAIGSNANLTPLCHGSVSAYNGVACIHPTSTDDPVAYVWVNEYYDSSTYTSPYSAELTITDTGVFKVNYDTNKGSVVFSYRTSTDHSSWTAWTAITDGAGWSKVAGNKYIQWKAVLTAGIATGDTTNAFTPTIYDITFSYYGTEAFRTTHNSILYKDRIYTSVVKQGDTTNTDIIVLDKLGKLRKYTGITASSLVVWNDKLYHGKAGTKYIYEYDENFTADYAVAITAFWEIPMREWAPQQEKILRYIMATFERQNKQGKVYIYYAKDDDDWSSANFYVTTGSDAYNHKIVPSVKRGQVYKLKISGTGLWKLVSLNPFVFIYPLQPAKFTTTQDTEQQKGGKIAVA